MDQNALKSSGVKTDIDAISNSFCLAKWYQITLNLDNGNTRSCHHVKSHRFDPKLLATNPAALHNTVQKKAARAQMLKGERPKECSYCWKIEDSGGVSDRYFKSSEDWAAKNLERAVASGAEDDVLPKYLEVSFDNVCNFKCAYCSPAYSTAWGAEIKKYGAYPTSRRFNDPVFLALEGSQPCSADERKLNSEAFWRWWPELGPSLQHLRVTGGEPLLSKETWKLFDGLIEAPKPDLHFSINSNMSAEPKMLDELIGKINRLEGKVKSFILYVSVDSIGAQAEYVRYGLNFDRFMANIHAILAKVRWPITVSYMISVNALSLPGLRPLLELILEQRRTYPYQRVRFDVPYLDHPEHMSVRILPRSWTFYLDDTLSFIRSSNADGPAFYDFEISRVERIRSLMMNPNITAAHRFMLRQDFAKMFHEYDRRRNVDFAATFPEHRKFWEYCHFIQNFTTLEEATKAARLQISIVIPSGGNLERLRACFASIREQTLASTAFEVLVGLPDNVAQGALDLVLESGIENIRTIFSPRATANCLRNRAAESGSAKWILFLDDDCLLEKPNALAERVARHEALAPNTVLCGDYVNDTSTGRFGRAYNLVASSWLRSAPQTGGAAKFLAGNVSLAREQFVSEKFDETLLNGGEELELASRLVQRGANFVFERKWSVVHRSDHTARTFFRRAWQHGTVFVKGSRRQRRRLSMGALAQLSNKVLRNLRPGPLAFLYLVTVKISRLRAQATLIRNKGSKSKRSQFAKP